MANVISSDGLWLNRGGNTTQAARTFSRTSAVTSNATRETIRFTVSGFSYYILIPVYFYAFMERTDTADYAGIGIRKGVVLYDGSNNTCSMRYQDTFGQIGRNYDANPWIATSGNTFSLAVHEYGYPFPTMATITAQVMCTRWGNISVSYP
jgi:hypothetical protein